MRVKVGGKAIPASFLKIINFSSRSNIRHDDGLQRLSISFIDKLHKNLSEMVVSL